MSKELVGALSALEAKGISKEVIVEAIEAALINAYKKNYNQAANVRVDLNLERGTMQLYSRKDVVEEVEDERLQISLADAQRINPNYELGDVVEEEETPRNFGRIAATTAKQIVTQRFREAERGIVYEEYVDRADDIINGVVERLDARNIYVGIGKIEAVLPQNEQIPGEAYKPHDRIKVYITKVERTSRGPQVFVSRTHPGLL
ncbi:MAG TPA: NusA N-terminal domain-containing protein, partial [Rummeliibacillus sp.]|nr:NusA N-terminal domain-containing protein [Rummeliibacillus sp.]